MVLICCSRRSWSVSWRARQGPLAAAGFELINVSVRWSGQAQFMAEYYPSLVRRATVLVERNVTYKEMSFCVGWLIHSVTQAKSWMSRFVREHQVDTLRLVHAITLWLANKASLSVKEFANVGVDEPSHGVCFQTASC